MTRRPNHFEKALAEAEKRLARALNEREQAQTVLNDLALEIPSLQQTIVALQHQLNPVTTLRNVRVNDNALDISPEAMALLQNSFDALPPSDNLITEDDLLPEPDGIALTPEE